MEEDAFRDPQPVVAEAPVLVATAVISLEFDPRDGLVTTPEEAEEELRQYISNGLATWEYAVQVENKT